MASLLLVISEGAVPSVVPDVVGDDPDTAQQRLEDFGFEVEFGDDLDLEWDDPLDGLVAGQDPAAGQTLEFGARVTLFVGRAATEVSVPSVVGDNAGPAQTEIEAAGLTWTRGADTLLAPGDSDIGRVVTQNPTAGIADGRDDGHGQHRCRGCRRPGPVHRWSRRVPECGHRGDGAESTHRGDPHHERAPPSTSTPTRRRPV